MFINTKQLSNLCVTIIPIKFVYKKTNKYDYKIKQGKLKKQNC